MTWLYHLGLEQTDPGGLQLHRSERTLLRRRIWSLRSTKRRIKRAAALVTTMTWRQNLHKLEVAQATMELQVQFWSAHSEFGK